MKNNKAYCNLALLYWNENNNNLADFYFKESIKSGNVDIMVSYSEYLMEKRDFVKAMQFLTYYETFKNAESESIDLFTKIIEHLI